VLFMDIRGFTAWSETRAADAVVEMLNGYFAAAERVLSGYEVVKSQFIGDEVMWVMSDTAPAVRSALALQREAGRFLAAHGLTAGIGVHRGVAIEGLIGALEVKSYTVIGDTVNTAKRVCDQAAGGEVLLTDPARQGLPAGTALGEPRDLQLKGKREVLRVFPVAGAASGTAA
jgi:class 3 adenylate cyclase